MYVVRYHLAVMETDHWRGPESIVETSFPRHCPGRRVDDSTSGVLDYIHPSGIVSRTLSYSRATFRLLSAQDHTVPGRLVPTMIPLFSLHGWHVLHSVASESLVTWTATQEPRCLVRASGGRPVRRLTAGKGDESPQGLGAKEVDIPPHPLRRRVKRPVCPP